MRVGFELVSDHEPGDRHDARVCLENAGDGTGPVFVDDHVVVDESHDVAACFDHGAVAGPVEARPGLAHVANERIAVAQEYLGLSIGGRVVDEQPIDLRILQRLKCVQTGRQIRSAIARAHSDSHCRTGLVQRGLRIVERVTHDGCAKGTAVLQQRLAQGYGIQLPADDWSVRKGQRPMRVAKEDPGVAKTFQPSSLRLATRDFDRKHSSRFAHRVKGEHASGVPIQNLTDCARDD